MTRSAFLFALMAASPSVAAGALNPLAAPSPTGPTPISSLPVIISESGSYIVTGNLTGVAASEGIFITASSVTLDLGGFELAGVPGSLNGIRWDPVSEEAQNLILRNGIVHGWGASGINLTGDGAIVENIASSDNSVHGIAVSRYAVVRDCVARRNTLDGFTALFSTLLNCNSSGNQRTGFGMGDGSSANGCVAVSNAQDGFRVGGGCRVVDCVAMRNQRHGIGASFNSLISDNECNFNGDNGGTGNGINVTSDDNRIDGNSCSDNDIDINVVGTHNAVIRNSANTYVVAVPNQFGPIENPSTSTHPYANIDY